MTFLVFLRPINRTQLIRFWSLQHVGIFPSIFPEAFGIVGAEILSSGLLPISSGVGGASELYMTVFLVYHLKLTIPPVSSSVVTHC